ncbi:MAG: hypothetical protein ACYCUG_06050 [Acidimicrobiales bacterium]
MAPDEALDVLLADLVHRVESLIRTINHRWDDFGLDAEAIYATSVLVADVGSRWDTVARLAKAEAP